MTVPSLHFLLFAAVAALVFNLSAAVWWRRVILLAANVIFLASFSRDLISFLPLAGFLAFGFVAQRISGNVSGARLFVALLAVIVSTFFWLKRYTFVPNELFLPFPYLLIGLSYIFFRVLHVIIDRHQGSIDERVGLLSYLNYTLNFTSLISGPIQRYEDYHRMELARLPLDLVVIGKAGERIVLGFFKVTIVSMLLSLAHHHAIGALSADQPLFNRVGLGATIAASYPLYLYFNFSGYMDVVIGVARFFRIELPENFDRPFAAENVAIFWNRWHITLSNWLKTYVYNPLMLAGMARITAPSLAPYVSVGVLFITFFLIGLWHGQTTEFLFFGLLTGGGLAANKLYQIEMQNRLTRQGYRALTANPIYQALGRGLTFTWFAFTQLWFWSSWSQLGDIAQSLGAAAILLLWLAIFVAATLLLVGIEATRNAILKATHDGAPIARSRYVRTVSVTALSIVTITTVALLDSPAPEIVYKAF